MDIVTISPGFQVVIPRAVREAMKLLPGEKMWALHFDGCVELIRVRDARELRGFLAGMDTAIERECSERPHWPDLSFGEQNFKKAKAAGKSSKQKGLFEE